MTSTLYVWQRATLVCLVLVYTGFYFCRTNLSVALPTILHSTHLNKAGFGTVISFGYGFYAVGKLLNGAGIDIVGGKQVLVVCLAGSIACTLMFGSISNASASVALFTIIWSANRVFQSGGWPALTTIVQAWFPSNQHGKVMGIASLSYSLGDAIIRLLLGKMLNWGMSWQHLFYLSALCATFLLIPSILYLHATPKSLGLQDPLEEHPLSSRRSRSLTRQTQSSPAVQQRPRDTSVPWERTSTQQQLPSPLTLVQNNNDNLPLPGEHLLPDIVVQSPYQSEFSPTIIVRSNGAPKRSPRTHSPSSTTTRSISSARSASQSFRRPSLRSPSSPTSSALTSPPSHRTCLSLYRPLLSQPKYYIIMLQSPILTWTREIFNSWIVVYLFETFHLSEGHASIISLAFPLLAAISSLGGGFLIDRLPKRRKGLLTLILIFLTTITFALFAYVSLHQPSPVKKPNEDHPADNTFTNNSEMMWAVILIGLSALFSTAPTSWVEGVFVMELTTKENSGLAVGSVHCSGSIGAIAAGHYVGYVVETYGWGRLFAIMCTASAVNTVLAALYWLIDLRRLRLKQLRSYERLS